MIIKRYSTILIISLTNYFGCEDAKVNTFDSNHFNIDQDVDMDGEASSTDHGDLSYFDMSSTSFPDMETSDLAVMIQLPDLDEGIRADTLLYAHLTVNQGRVNGSHSRFEDGILLDRGSSIRWTLDHDQIPVGAILSLSAKTRIWRVEDGQVLVKSNQHQGQYNLWGSGLLHIAPVRYRYADWTEDGYGLEGLPPLLSWPITDSLHFIEITAEHGGLIISDLYLHGTHADPSWTQVESPSSQQAEQTLEYRSCLPLEECDDGAELSRLLNESSSSSVEIELSSERYIARTSVMINRSNVSIRGTYPSVPPIWQWSPQQNSGQSWPFIFKGEGIIGEGLPLLEGIEYGQRHIRLNQVLEAQPTWLRLTAEDFGDIPQICIDGRDIERRNRHQRQLFRVLDMVIDQEDTLITLDRPIFVQIPVEAIPKISVVSLLTGLDISRISLQADCEAALTTEFQQANCQNNEVIDDGAILSLYTDGLKMNALSATGFGKFSFEIRDSLHNVVTHSFMHHPSAYGSGGQGYGVHLIGASRTVISHLNVHHARHGVVVDFGSSDSQILNGVYTDMNQALIDVHGEASRDTLIRDNHLENSSIGVIIGGGGRTVHCNDGPRHHIQLNQISGCGIAVLVSDETENTSIHSNTLLNNGTHVGSAYGAHNIQVERNQLENAMIKPISVGFETTRDMRVIRNLFRDHCSLEDSVLQLNGAELPEFIDNIWCPR